MTNDFIETLLNQEENVSLDFKSEQYEFYGTTNDKKAELLKDILAFANASRLTNAYILIGVQEIKGRRAKVLGVENHFDDAQIQQFVNSKLNKPITFSYQTFQFEGKIIDIIKIPIQNRPFYLKKNFGRLQKNTVYIRRGTSTDIADPDEIAQMCTAQTASLIEKRLRVYQEAYSLSEKLKSVIHSDDSTKIAVIQQARNWFNENNLYLNPDIRKEFQECIGNVGIYKVELENYRATGMEKGWNSEAAKREKEELKAKFDKIQQMNKRIQASLDILL